MLWWTKDISVRTTLFKSEYRIGPSRATMGLGPSFFLSRGSERRLGHWVLHNPGLRGWQPVVLSWRAGGVGADLALAGSVALPGTISVPQWSALCTLQQRARTSQWGRLVSPGMGPCPHPWSLSASTTGGTRAPLGWPWTCWSPMPLSWWHVQPGWCRAAQFSERSRVWTSLVHAPEGFGLEDLKDRHGVKRRGRLSTRFVGASSECWSCPTGLGRVGGLCHPTNGRGRA